MSTFPEVRPPISVYQPDQGKYEKDPDQHRHNNQQYLSYSYHTHSFILSQTTLIKLYEQKYEILSQRQRLSHKKRPPAMRDLLFTSYLFFYNLFIQNLVFRMLALELGNNLLHPLHDLHIPLHGTSTYQASIRRLASA